MRSLMAVSSVLFLDESLSIQRAPAVPAEEKVRTSALGGSSAVAIWISLRRSTSSRITASRSTSEGM